MQQDNRYDYTQAGFNAFLSRSIDSRNQDALGVSPIVQSKQVAYDRTQVSGMMGDTLQIGQVHINKTNITMSDGQNDRLLIGEDKGGF